MPGIYLFSSAFSLLRASGPRRSLFCLPGWVEARAFGPRLVFPRWDSSFHLESLRAFGTRLTFNWTLSSI
uniref:Uncharacterized protein n=1 Tax=Meloidogyne enterolobii TaxID=390850 RepID=A0A6V7Y978_MELEN|nr:unnamed protein product [Meloidogyne enterolobii]